MKKIYPIKKNNRFYMHEEHLPESILWETLPSFLVSLRKRKERVPHALHEWHVPHIPPSSSHELRITWIGHATFLIQVRGISILTDPIFGNVSLLYPRIVPAGVACVDLPPIDYVLLSHNHRDHMDSSSLYALKEKHACTVLVPEGDKRWFDKHGFAPVIENMWWQTSTFEIPGASKQPLRCTFLPAVHWSQRGIFDKNKSLWGSWMIEIDGYTLYFAGDTAYGEHFLSIRHHFPAIDIALMPVGPCQPRHVMKKTHTNAHEAGQGFLDLNAQFFIPMHWGTFLFGTDHFALPITLLQEWWQQEQDQLRSKQLHILKSGQSFVMDK